MDLVAAHVKMKWKVDHINYIEQLPQKDKSAISLYTGCSFFRAINATHQGALDFTLVSKYWQEPVVEYCELNNNLFNPYSYTHDEFVDFVMTLSNHIDAIIRAAPVITEPVVVYRGVKTKYFCEESTFVHLGFISTSLERHYAMHFARNKKDEYKYLLVATLQPGTKCLFHPVEYEILLPLNTHMEIIEKVECDNLEGEYRVAYST